MNDRFCSNHDLSLKRGLQPISRGDRSRSLSNPCGLPQNREGEGESVIATTSPIAKFVRTDCRCGTLADVRRQGHSIARRDVLRIVELERELDAMRTELQGALCNLEIAKKEQGAIDREVSLTLMETLKRQHTGSTDLQRERHGSADAKLFLSTDKSDPRSGERHLEGSRNSSALIAWRRIAAKHIARLTPRQHEIMELVLAGRPSKSIAAHLGISQRTVENHRAAIMKKTESKSLPELTRLAFFAGEAGSDGLLFPGALPVLVPQQRAGR